MRLVREHNHGRPVAKHFRRLEFVDERENVAMISTQQLPQMRTAHGVALVAPGFAHRAGSLERLGNLVIQLHAVGHDYESLVARHLAQHLLCEKHWSHPWRFFNSIVAICIKVGSDTTKR